MLIKTATIILAATIGLALPATAQEAAENPVCQVMGENGMVTLLLCPEGLSQELLASEGVAACTGRLPCGAWIWTDATMIPAEAPDSHDKLTKAEVKSATAIWVAEQSKLIQLNKIE